MEIELLNCSLPKWPHLIIAGKQVTREQAKDIIFKTDSWFTGTMMRSHSNNPRAIHEEYRRISGLSEFSEVSERVYEHRDTFIEYNLELWNLSETLSEHLNIVSNNYICSDMADSHYISGAHGICDANGNIFYDRNIGKHPDALEVYNEFKTMVKQFPYLELHAALYDIEKCQRDERPARQVVGFIVTDGDVIATNVDMGLDDKTNLEDNDIDFRDMLNGKGICGIPDEWFYEYAERVRKGMKELDIFTRLDEIKKDMGMI